MDVLNVILGMAMFICSQKIILKNYGDEHQGVVMKVPITYKNLSLVHQIHCGN